MGLPIFLVVRGASTYGEALLALTGTALIVTGLVQKGAQTEGARTSESLESSDGVILGLVQGLSAVPGLSRSGLTTSALLIRNYSGEESFRISFIMSVPAVFAAAVGLMYLEGAPPLESGLLISLVSSFFSAYLSIDVLLRVARRVRFWGLCVFLGTLAILPLVAYLF